MDSNSGRNNTSKARGPRLYHRKSRNGCERCRARRVKCDEVKPVCSSCNRHRVSCKYDTLTSSDPRSLSLTEDVQKRSSSKVDSAVDEGGENNSSIPSTVFLPHPPALDIPETKSRRKLELRLFQNFITDTSINFPACHNTEVQKAWSVEVPKLALEHDNLLYEVLALSALHLLRIKPNDPELLEARQTYLGLSLHEHRRAISKLSFHQQSANVQSADATLFASIMLLYDAFASLQDRVVDPYSPPIEWLYMSRGVGSAFEVAWDAIKNLETTKIKMIVRSPPYLDDEQALFSESNRKKILGFLSRDIPGDEPWDEETKETYEKTLSYIGSMQLAVESNEEFLGICRRIMAFPVWIPRKFIDFVEERRPRALILLARFFSFAAGRKDIWWIDGIVQREIEGIRTTLPVELQGLAMAGLAGHDSQQ